MVFLAAAPKVQSAARYAIQNCHDVFFSPVDFESKSLRTNQTPAVDFQL
jgi:hypothetical protein